MAVPRMLFSLRVLLLCVLLQVCHSQQEVTIGIQYLNYTVYTGLLANGQCCDSPTSSTSPPTCPPDQCDVAFMPCAERILGTCDLIQKQESAVFENSNSEVIGNKLGNGANQSSSLFIFKIPYDSAPINFTIFIVEKDTVNQGRDSEVISSWNFVINWLDPFFNATPIWHEYFFKSSNAELGLNAVSMCSSHWFGPTCSIYCRSTFQYDCLNDGSKKCKQGWKEPDCKDMIDHCPGHQCQHGSTCNNTLTGYTCLCATYYTGQFCEIDTRLPTTTPVTTTTQVPITTTKAANTNDDDVAIGVGTSMGLLALLALAALIIYLCMRKKKEKKKTKVAPEEKPEDMTQNTHGSEDNRCWDSPD